MISSTTTPRTPTRHERIFVRLTNPGTGGITTLLLDGPALMPLLAPLLRSRRPLTGLTRGDLLLAKLYNQAGEFTDEVVVAPLGAQDSPTGHEQIELSCHGGEGALRAVSEALEAAGFIAADGVELLRRTHLNGKMSLVTLEAQLRLARAVTSRQADFLLAHAEFQQRWERLGLEMGLGLRAGNDAWRARLLSAACAALAQAPAAQALLRAHHVALLGPANAGKSTLANLLSRSRRHLVSEFGGATRDRLDTPLALRGLHVLLSDTAGWRSARDELDQESQRRAGEAAQAAEMRLFVMDGARAAGEAELAQLENACRAGPLMLVLNKRDLGLDASNSGLGFVAGGEPYMLSALTGAGLDELECALERRLLAGEPAPGMPFTRRQVGLLERLRAGLEQRQDGIAILVHLRKLVGTKPDEEGLKDVLNEIADCGLSCNFNVTED